MIINGVVYDGKKPFVIMDKSANVQVGKETTGQKD
jgi:hypothetical protein